MKLRVIHLGIPLTELLELERSMSKYLSPDIPGGIDLHGQVDHLENAPVLFLQTITEEFLPRYERLLIGWVADPGAVAQDILCIDTAWDCTANWLGSRDQNYCLIHTRFHSVIRASAARPWTVLSSMICLTH